MTEQRYKAVLAVIADGRTDATFSMAACDVMAALPAVDVERARRFYGEKLGLTAAPGAVPGSYIYWCGGAGFALYQTSGRASGTHQQMGFIVSDLDAVVAS